MPCITGRSSHNLCTPTCDSASICCYQYVPYSANKVCICSDDDPINNKFSLGAARNMICDAIASSIDSTIGLVSSTPTSLATLICTDVTFPDVGCPVVLYAKQGTASSVRLATIIEGSCINLSTDVTNFETGEINILVDNNECIIMNNIALFGP